MRLTASAVLMALSLSLGSLLPACDQADGSSALAHRDRAFAAAREWDQGAELTRVIGFEGVNWAELVEGFSYGAVDEATSRSANDDEVGDGHSEIWIYRFASTGKPEAYSVVIDGDGDVLSKEPEELDDGDIPVEEWTIDSDEAAEIATDRNPHLRRGAEAENAGIVLILQRDSATGNATWKVAGGGGDSRGGGGGEVIVDAVTGEVVKSHGSSGGA